MAVFTNNENLVKGILNENWFPELLFLALFIADWLMGFPV